MKTKHLILIAIGVIVLMVAPWAIKYYTAEIRGKIDAKEKIESAEHRLYSYEYFYDKYGSIQSYKTTLESQYEVLESAESKKERARIRSNIAGIKSQLRRSIEEYNAEANKIKTKGKFREDDLPVEIEMENIIKKINY